MVQAKFVRANLIPTGTPIGFTGEALWMYKVIYEFWGFCVNGGNSLIAPGGFATSQATGSYLSMPVGFESGSTVLLGYGSDGQTTLGLPYFTVTGSTPFSASYLNKYLVTWKSGSTSTDDSIYQIVDVVSPTEVVLNPSTGGTPFSASNVPSFTTRTGISYRIVDLVACSELAGIVTGQYMVLQFNGAPLVNPGQAASQFRIRGSFGGGINAEVAITLSPSGSWDGTQFVGESYPELSSEGSIVPDWWRFSASNSFTLWGWPDFLTVYASQVDGGDASSANCLTVEIPQRLYPQAQDPNPICGINMGNSGFYASTTTTGFGTRYFPSPYDATLRKWQLLQRPSFGAYWNGSYMVPGVGANFAYGENVVRYSFNFNQLMSKFMTQDTLLALPSIPGQYSLGRARLRTMRFTSAFYDYWLRAGDLGGPDQWMHCGNGIWMPWDGSVFNSRLLWSQS